MNKKLAQMVLAITRDIATNNTSYSYAVETLSKLILKYWERTPRSDECDKAVAAWRQEYDYQSAVALASWLLAQ